MDGRSLRVCVAFREAYLVLPGFLDEKDVVGIDKYIKKGVGGGVGFVNIVREEADGEVEGVVGDFRGGWAQGGE